DDDDLRRGRPTVHRRYDEATAVLVGDALLTLAFGLLGRLRPAERSVACVIELARGAGSVGMAGGQMLDIQSEGGERSAGRLAAIHTMKTAALIRSSAVCGALAAGAPDGRVAALALYGEKVGLAFQVVDDILDCEGTPETLGKPSGRDAEEGKLTYPAVFGLEASKLRARSLMEEGLAALAPLGEGGRRLREIAEFVVTRTK
ncbi:MAG: polyprenyl synthetase family protein, partial [Planctomycetes bacterium]|nr:polyprenyl synthetase family protein [Planctomycetota bacterium]